MATGPSGPGCPCRREPAGLGFLQLGATGLALTLEYVTQILFLDPA